MEIAWIAATLLTFGGPRSHAGPAEATEVRGAQEVREVYVDVGRSQIHALCVGEAPAVIVLHDGGSSAEAWRSVLRLLDGRVGACAYDRPGTGSSGPAPSRRGWYELLDEMRRVHEALGARPGTVLVGHGLGGFYARLYASDRPGDVGGVVLVDPEHEDLPRRMRPGMPADAWEAWSEARNRPNDDGIVEARLDERAGRARLPRVPSTVVTSTGRRDGDGWNQRFLDEAARQVHATILRGIPRARHVPAAGDQATLPTTQAELIAREIERAVAAAGRPG